jgi:hypothetical protein
MRARMKATRSVVTLFCSSILIAVTLTAANAGGGGPKGGGQNTSTKPPAPGPVVRDHSGGDVPKGFNAQPGSAFRGFNSNYNNPPAIRDHRTTAPWRPSEGPGHGGGKHGN